MWHYLKKRLLQGTFMISLTLAIQIMVLVLSLAKINPGFWPKTTPARLYASSGTNAALIVVLALCLLALRHFRDEARRVVALLIVGMLWGIGAASFWGFDPGLGSCYFACSFAILWSINPHAKDVLQIVSRPCRIRRRARSLALRTTRRLG